MAFRTAKIVLEIVPLKDNLSNLHPWLKSTRNYLAKNSAMHLVRPENNIPGTDWAEAGQQAMVKLEVAPRAEGGAGAEAGPPALEDPVAALEEEERQPALTATEAALEVARAAAKAALDEDANMAVYADVDWSSSLTEVERMVIGTVKPFMSPNERSRHENAAETTLRYKVWTELVKSLHAVEHLLVTVVEGHIYQLVHAVLRVRSTTALTSMDALAKLAALTKGPGVKVSQVALTIKRIEESCRQLGAPPITEQQRVQALLRACKQDPALRNRVVDMSIDGLPHYEAAVLKLSKLEAILSDGRSGGGAPGRAMEARSRKNSSLCWHGSEDNCPHGRDCRFTHRAKAAHGSSEDLKVKGACFNCGSTDGHWAKDCPMPRKERSDHSGRDRGRGRERGRGRGRRGGRGGGRSSRQGRARAAHGSGHDEEAREADALLQEIMMQRGGEGHGSANSIRAHSKTGVTKKRQNAQHRQQKADPDVGCSTKSQEEEVKTVKPGEVDSKTTEEEEVPSKDEGPGHEDMAGENQELKDQPGRAHSMKGRRSHLFGLLDTGADAHYITPTEFDAYATDVQAVHGTVKGVSCDVLTYDMTGKILAYDVRYMRAIILKDARRTRGADESLVSVSCLSKQGYKVKIYANGMGVFTSDNKCMSEATMKDGVYPVMLKIIPNVKPLGPKAYSKPGVHGGSREHRSHRASLARTFTGKLQLGDVIHNKLAHACVHVGPVKDAVEKSHGRAAAKSLKSDHMCVHCGLSKTHSFAHPRGGENRRRPTKPGERLHFDLVPFPIRGENGEVHALIGWDEATGAILVDTDLKSKADGPKALMKLVDNLYSEFGLKPRDVFVYEPDYMPTATSTTTIRTDGGTEFVNKEVKAFAKAKGIRLEVSCAYDKAQNGYAENAVKILTLGAEACRLSANLPRNRWPRCLKYFAYTYMRTPNKCAGVDKDLATPLERILDKQLCFKTMLKWLHPLGCLVFVLIPPELRRSRRLGIRGLPAVFMGYGERSKGYIVYYVATKQYSETVYQVIFDETTFPLRPSDLARVAGQMPKSNLVSGKEFMEQILSLQNSDQDADTREAQANRSTLEAETAVVAGSPANAHTTGSTLQSVPGTSQHAPHAPSRSTTQEGVSNLTLNGRNSAVKTENLTPDYFEFDNFGTGAADFARGEPQNATGTGDRADLGTSVSQVNVPQKNGAEVEVSNDSCVPDTRAPHANACLGVSEPAGHSGPSGTTHDVSEAFMTALDTTMGVASSENSAVDSHVQETGSSDPTTTNAQTRASNRIRQPSLRALETMQNEFERQGRASVAIDCRNTHRHTTNSNRTNKTMAMGEELKKVKGDLQTATREELHAKKRLEVNKFTSDLDKVSNRAEMATTLYNARLNDAKQQLMNSDLEGIEQEVDIFEPVTENEES